MGLALGHIDDGVPVILVMSSLDPAWTSLLPKAAGVVLERGGLLSHAAILAREYGIPMVAGVEGAVSRIPNGARLRMDGGRGVVSVIDEG